MCVLARVGKLSKVCLEDLLITSLVYVGREEMIPIQHLSRISRQKFPLHKSY